MTGRLRLGDLLVAANIIDPAQLDEALAQQKEAGLRLGETLVALGHVSELQVAQTLSHQLSVPWANLRHVDFSRELLNRVPAELAERAHVVPVYVRRVKGQGDVLFVATDDPLNEAGLAELASVVGMPIKPMVASALDVREALRVYYGRLVLPPRLPNALDAEVEGDDIEIELDPASIVPPARPAKEPSEPAEAERVRRPKPTPKSEPEPVAEPEAAPAPVAPKPKMLTLTLLDGTKVSLPTPSADAPEGQSATGGLTTRDLIRALLLSAEGRDVSEVLPDQAWQPLFATLLSILLKKGLVADWEFLDEWAKVRRIQAKRG